MSNSNIIIVNARFLTQPLTGVQRYAFECSIQMKKINPRIQFVSPSTIIQHEWAQELDVQIIGSKTGHLWEQLDLPRYVRKHPNSLLFNPCNTAPYFIKNQVITIHDISFYKFPENNSFIFRTWYNLLIPKIAKKSLHVFTVSESVRNELMKTYQIAEQKISVTYNGLPETFLKYDSQSIQKEKLILAVGSISKRKNTHLLAKAFIQSDIKDEYTLVIIGSSADAFSTLEMPEHSKILRLQSVSDEELISYYQRSEIFVSLSEYEGFGIPVLEALYFQCKVLCSNIDVYRELFGEYVYFCDSMNMNHLQESLRVLTKKPIPQFNIESLKHSFSFIKSAEHILSVMDKLFSK